MLFLLSLAFAVPLDTAGAWQPLVELPLHLTTSPGPMGTPMTPLMAFGETRTSVFTVLSSPYGADLLELRPDGSLDRWDSLILTPAVMGHFEISGTRLQFCAMPMQPMQVDLSTGEVVSNGPALEVQKICGYYSAADEQRFLLGVSGEELMAVLDDDRVVAELPIGGGSGAGDSAVGPCGRSDARPLATSVSDGELRVGVLGSDGVPAASIWSTAIPEEHGFTDLAWSTSCTLRGDSAVFAGGGQVYVWERGELTSVLRNSTPPSERQIPRGTGPFAFDRVQWAGVVGDLLAIYEIEPPRLSLFHRPLPEGAKTPTPLTRVRANPVGSVERLEAMLDLGWWEAVEKEAHQAGNNALYARSRAMQFVRWSRRGDPAAVWTVGNTTKALEVDYLAEVDELLLAHPDGPYLLLARALLSKRLGRSSDSLAALTALERALPESGLSAHGFPELFDLAERRGDIAAMARIYGTLDEVADSRRRHLWSARVHRVAGTPSRGLKELEALDATDGEASLLRGHLMLDAGRVDQAIASYIRSQKLLGAAGSRVDASLGLAYLRRGLVELAVESLVKAVDSAPTDLASRSNLAEAYRALDRESDAMKLLYGALAESPDDPVLQYQLNRPTEQHPTGSGPTYAVLPLQTAGSPHPRVGFGDFMATMTLTALIEGGATVVERSRLDAILAEQKLQSSQFIDPSTAVKVGKGLGAAVLITGNAADFESSVRIDLRAVDVRSGEVLGSAGETVAKDPEALAAGLSRLIIALR